MISKKHKEEVLSKIKKDFENMADTVIKQLIRLEEIVTDTTVNVTDEVYKEMHDVEKGLNDIEVKISNDIVNALVLQQPAASDLRLLIAIQRMTLDLERVGDLVMNIVKFISKIENKNLPRKYSESISNMLVIAVNMVKKAIKSFELQDKDYAIWAIKNDDVVDDMNKNIFKNILNKTTIEDENMKDLFLEFLNVNNIINTIERIADKATGIAEASIYFMKGIDLRHQEVDADEL